MVVRPTSWLAYGLFVFAWSVSAQAQAFASESVSEELSAEQMAALSDQQLRAALTRATDTLCGDLGRLKGGAPWTAFFKVDDLKKAMSEDEREVHESTEGGGREQPAPPSEPGGADRRAMLNEIADRFDKIAGDEKYRQIAACTGFRTLQIGLREYALPPQKRQDHVLTANLQILVNSLEQLSNGPSWKRFLQLDQLERLATSDAPLEPTDFARMAQILSRFETARQDPDYGMIVEQPGFDTTYTALADLFQLWD
jgi:hypothetical protein